MSPKQIRRAAGRSLAWVAVMAEVSEPSARLYEVDPEDQPRDPVKRAQLARVYREMERAVANKTTTKPPTAA